MLHDARFAANVVLIYKHSSLYPIGLRST